MRKKIITDDYEFANLIRGNAVYVDKTDLLARLASGRDGSQFFIARPRRFGKSLMLSTLHHMFAGDRDLFKGLKIMKTGWDWSKTYPVIHLDMSEVKGKNIEELEAALYYVAESIASSHALELDWAKLKNSSQAFSACLKALGEKGPFVVLVDEYDVPLQGFLGSTEVRAVRQLMHDFYLQLKRHVGSIRFLMVTGVTKLTKVALFSSLNNLRDLTMDGKPYAGLLGYTKEEIKTYFSDGLAALATHNDWTKEQATDQLLAWYDSYRFCPDSNVRVCNPISVGRALESGDLKSYWVKTASATLLVERMRLYNAKWNDFEQVTATEDELDVCDAITMPLIPLMYQAGYLTIKGKSKTETDEYGQPKLILGIPNHEVRGALKGAFWNQLMQIEEKSFTALVHVAERQIAAGDIEGLLDTLYGLYAKLPPTWTPKTEQDAKRYFLLFMEMAGATMQPEKPSFRGFADAVVETKKGVWIFEFKFNRSADSAIRQIRERGYAEPYRAKVEVKGQRSEVKGRGRNVQPTSNFKPQTSNFKPQTSNLKPQTSNLKPITLVGIKFDSKRKNIDMPKIEAL